MKKGDIRKLDREFSELIRSKGYCEKCGSTSYLQTSHIYSRRFYAIRWTPENAMCLCAKCHMWWHHKPIDAVEWANEHLGGGRVQALRVMSLKAKKWKNPEDVRKQWRTEN